ncbi:MAG: hypothetical protein J1E16_08890 [Muribaculaceae bacterium]|nr:hypothetical protein [Muribaculaceae bacterium]
MKILFIGDYSNLHTTLARELRRMGHQADVLSDRCGHMNLSTDFYLKRTPGIIGGFKYLFELFNLLPLLRNYDVVQLINTNFLSLKPQKYKYFYDILKKQNGSIFLTLAGNDYYFCKACYDAKLFRFSEFKIGEEFAPGHLAKPEHLYGWISNANKNWADYLLENINGAMAVLPEYEMPVKGILGEKVKFTNLPVDFSELPSNPVHFSDDKVNIFVGMRSGYEDMKGSKILYKIAKELEDEMPEKVKTDLVKDLPFNEFLNRLAKTDIVLDQLYSYSPAMTALYAMGLGKVVGTGAQPEYYEYIGNSTEQPLLSLSPFDKDIKERLVNLIENKNEILKRGEQGRNIALKHNDSRLVAQRFLDHWQNKG